MAIVRIPRPFDPKPGVYRVEVARAQSKTSNAGHPQVVLNLRDANTRADLAADFVTFSPGNGERIARQKLKAFGLDPDDAFDTDELVGKRAYVALVETEYQGQVRLSVDGKRGANCGYWPEDSPPAEYEAPADADAPAPITETGTYGNPNDDDTPFL